MLHLAFVSELQRASFEVAQGVALEAGDALLPALVVPEKKLASLDDALASLAEQGRVARFRRYADAAHVVLPAEGVSWPVVACDLSRLVRGGQWLPGGTGATWNRGGPGGRCHYLLQPSVVFEVVAARRIHERLFGALPHSWSLPGVARAMIRATGLKQSHVRPLEVFRKGARWHYYHCEPGTYSEKVYLYDIEAAYFSLLSMLPCPYLWQHSGEELYYGKLTGREREQWTNLLAAMAPEKRLRNSLIGSLYGSGGKGVRYIDGVASKVPAFDGPLRPAALYVVRCAYEICALAWQEQHRLSGLAPYANTDCVVSACPDAPRIWRDLGLHARLQAEGDAEVCNLGTYRVGDKETAFYKAGSRLAGAEISLSIDGPIWSRFLPRR